MIYIHQNISGQVHISSLSQSTTYVDKTKSGRIKSYDAYDTRKYTHNSPNTLVPTSNIKYLTHHTMSP